MSDLPHLPGVLTADEVRASGGHLASLQVESGMIPWWPGGHCDPWNHVESAMALDVAGFHEHARRAYRWLADIQRADGSWHNYYWPDNSVEDAKLDSNVCAYIATGLWHHWRITGDTAFVTSMWPTLEAALGFVLDMRLPNGTILWARHAETWPWNYALLTGSASIQHALRLGDRLAAEALGEGRPHWVAAADAVAAVICDDEIAFEPKTRWAMDWYYPVLTGAMCGEAATARLAERFDVFAMDGKGIRCVSDEPWITASETAECSLAYAAIGDVDTATDLLAWTRSHRLDDGSYYTGLVYPDRVRFPFDERTSYTAAAVILAADAISGATGGSRVFAGIAETDSEPV